MTLPILTNSAMRSFRRCSREYQLSYVLGYRPVRDAEPLRFGSLVHAGLEAWWKSPTPDERLHRALAVLADDTTADPYDIARASVLLIGYDSMWSGEPYEVLAVEAEFRAPLVNPLTGQPSRTFQLGGKLDVVVHDLRDDRVKLVEHKTAADDIGAGSDYWKRLVLDPQVSTYFAGGQAAGYPIEECVYDVLGKPALRPASVPLVDADGTKIVLDASGARVRTKDGKAWRQTGDTAAGYVAQTRPETPAEFHQRLATHIAENPSRYYQRGTVVRLEQEMRDAAHDAWSIARNIRDAALADRWPRNPDACIRYSRTCAFFGACTGTASLDDPTEFRRTDQPHEELSSDAA